MAQNLGTIDRIARGAGAVILFVVSAVSPLPVALQVAVGLMGVYVLGSSLVGTCLGYKMMGMSTCPVPKR